MVVNGDLSLFQGAMGEYRKLQIQSKLAVEAGMSVMSVFLNIMSGSVKIDATITGFSSDDDASVAKTRISAQMASKESANSVSLVGGAGL